MGDTRHVLAFACVDQELEPVLPRTVNALRAPGRTLVPNAPGCFPMAYHDHTVDTRYSQLAQIPRRGPFWGAQTGRRQGCPAGTTTVHPHCTVIYSAVIVVCMLLCVRRGVEVPRRDVALHGIVHEPTSKSSAEFRSARIGDVAPISAERSLAQCPRPRGHR